MIIEDFNNSRFQVQPMSTVNFSVPDSVKVVFNKVFAGRNKSAIIAGLMLEAVDREMRLQRRRTAYLSILSKRKRAPTIDHRKFRIARESGRP